MKEEERKRMLEDQGCRMREGEDKNKENEMNKLGGRQRKVI
jgi:hypothetical protein